MKFQYRKALNMAEDERILFKQAHIPKHAIGVMRKGNEVHVKVLGSISGDFYDGPEDITYWPNLDIDVVKLAVQVYDLFQKDDWRDNTAGLYFETFRK